MGPPRRWGGRVKQNRRRACAGEEGADEGLEAPIGYARFFGRFKGWCKAVARRRMIALIVTLPARVIPRSRQL
jgi:hypothetical protein